MTKRELFESLPEHRVPERPRGAARLQEARRDQVALRAVDLDGLVAPDDMVREVWAFVESLDLGSLYDAIAAREGEPGRPPIDPKILMALWLYATIRGIGSGRAVERLCGSDHGFQWLCGGVGVNYHTLTDFRVAHAALVDHLLSESVAVLVAEGLVRLDRLALDGLRVRASAGAASFRRRKRLEQYVKEAATLVRGLRRELEEDPAAGERRRRAAALRGAAEREARLRAARRRLAELEEERARREKTNKEQTGKQGEPRASTTDPQARVMKMPDGGYRPAYNGELVCDPQSQVIVGVDVDTTGSDHGWIAPMLRQVCRRYGRKVRQLLVDGAFSRAGDLEWAHQNRVAVFLAPTRTKHGTDPYRPRKGDGPGVAAWRSRMASPEGQAIYRHRSRAECVNADLRYRGLIRLTVRGTAKARTVFTWFALAHNLMRGLSLRRLAAAA
jgi:transposase